MADPYTIKKLTDVDDSAAKFGFSDNQETRFAARDMESEEIGLSHHRVKPGKRQGFAHKHDEAEEIYVVLAGSGRVKLDEDIADLSPRDAIRVSPGVVRQFEAGPDGLELLVFGIRHEGDGELLHDWWTD